MVSDDGWKLVRSSDLYNCPLVENFRKFIELVNPDHGEEGA